jgi:hypothetical protein
MSDDLGVCPYFWRYECLPGYDPDAVCAFGCRDEPECVTCAPSGGWPSVNAALASSRASVEEQHD